MFLRQPQQLGSHFLIAIRSRLPIIMGAADAQALAGRTDAHLSCADHVGRQAFALTGAHSFFAIASLKASCSKLTGSSNGGRPLMGAGL